MDAPTDSGLNTDNITNIDEPDFVGSGLPPGSTVTLNGDLDGLLGTAIVQSDGTWKIPSKKLRVGKQKVRATVTDPTGTATSAPSAPLDIEIDLVATKPVITKLSDATNSGSKSDSLTNLTTVELEGTAEANSTVVLKNGSGPTLGTGTADGSGNWKISIVPGVTGVIPVTVTATDVAGNTANSDPFNFEIDTTKPATPTAPDLTAGTDTGVNNDDITSNAQPTFTGTGAEVGGTVKLFSDGSLIGEVLSPDGTWTIPSTVALAVGDRNITVTVTDAAGNVSDPSPVLPVKIVGAPPAPSAPNLLAADDSGLPADNITNVLEPNVTGTSTAPDGSTITLYDGTDVIGTGAIAGGTWTVKLTPKRTGKQKIKAQVTNVAGGTSPFSAETEIDIDPSTDIPVITDLLAASDSGVKGDKITNALEPDLTGTAEPNSSIELFDENAVKIGTGTTDGTGKWTIKIRPNRKGKIKVKAVATDIAGNVSSPSADTEITIDDVALATIPDLTDATDTGINNDDITSNIKPDFTGIAEPGSTVKLFSDKDGLIGTVVANATTGVWTITSTQDLQPGAHAITTQIDTDIAGNQSPISSPLNIRILAAPGTVTVDLNTPSDSKGDSDTDNITNVKQPTFSGIADANSSIKLFAQIGTGARVQIGTGTANPNGDWTIAVSSDLADAIYSITADATELAAGTTKTSAPLNVTIDTLAPSAPLVPDLEDASDSGLNSDNITNVEEPFFVLTAEPNLTVTLFSDLEGTDPIGTGKADATGKVRIQAKKLRAGKHNIRAKATDIAGNISGFSPDLVVDVMTSGSAVTIDLLSEDTGASTSDRLTSDSTPQFDGTAGANADIELIFSGAATKTITGIKADAQGKWVYQILDADLLADGDYTLVAKATDPVSNVSNSSPFSFTIDSLVPGIPTVDLTDGSDDGLSNSDNETTIARPIFTGTADADVLVEVYAGTNLIGTTNADTTGKWTLPALTTPLALGNYNITAKAKRRSGKTSDSTALPIKIVAPLPNVTLAIDKTTLTESEGTATLTATLSVAYPQAVTVNLGFSGTATNGTDYRLSATAIVIEPGRTSGSVTLKTTRDAIADNNETILVDILSVINGVEATPQQVRATIQENSLPVAQSVAGSVNPILLGGTATIKGISATDADGTITSYQIVTLPAADQGVLFLGSPTAGGRPVTAGQRLTITDIGRLTFRASSSFKETRFTYAAIDNLGDLSNPATINLIVSGPDPDADENGPCGKGRTFNGKTKNDRFKGGKGADRVKGGKGNDRLSGGLCSDIMVGGSGNDRLMGDSGADKIQGGSGNDRIDGGTGLDTLNGGSGNDMLLGRAGHDRLRGGTGKDRLKGGTGNDRLNGNILNDLLKGEAGDDLLNGGVGSDRLIGGSGNDMMVGRTGNERMRGGLGDDVLYGGLGKDIMNGGPGRDRFVYRRLDEKGDRINGFVPADDVIDLRDIFRSRATGNPNAFSEFVKLAQRGTSTIVRVDSNGNAAGGLTTLAVMQGVNASSLTASNFLLS
ncbi:MAG: Ig-like domain-containing protein [Oculatellaceae cyanobacterium Prado106]|nr:Ig-like domain-containing protein [Oculatellaceae cyanobacterium Prado106]